MDVEKRNEVGTLGCILSVLKLLYVPIGLHVWLFEDYNDNEIVVYKMDTCISNCFENIEVITIKLETRKVNKITNKNEKTAPRARAR